MLLPDHSKELADLVEKHGLGDVREPIVSAAYSRIDFLPARPEDYSAVCASRFGGDPDLPRGCSWADDVRDMVFVFQLNLGEIDYVAELGLPGAGMFYVFSDADADSGATYFVSDLEADFERFSMPDPQPDYIFSNMKCWGLTGRLGVDCPQYGSEEFDIIEDAGLEGEYEEMCDSLPGDSEAFCQLAGRFAELNGDLRNDAAQALGGAPTDWQSLWKICSNFKSGLVISDFHVLHGMIRTHDLRELDFGKVFSVREVV